MRNALPIVEVEWVDSHVHDRWVTPADLEDTGVARCSTVGYLIQDSPLHVTVAQSVGTKVLGDVEEYGQPITIPRVALTGEPRRLHGGLSVDS